MQAAWSCAMAAAVAVMTAVTMTTVMTTVMTTMAATTAAPAGAAITAGPEATMTRLEFPLCLLSAMWRRDDCGIAVRDENRRAGG